MQDYIGTHKGHDTDEFLGTRHRNPARPGTRVDGADEQETRGARRPRPRTS